MTFGIITTHSGYCYQRLESFQCVNTALSKIKLSIFFNSLNRLSFGIYLVHILVMWMFADAVINPLQVLFHPILSIPLTVIFVVIVSSLVTFHHQQNTYGKKINPLTE